MGDTPAKHRVPKIRYRLVFNRARRLNKRGEGLVQVECQQGQRRCYFSTGVYLTPEYWKDGQVVDHELSSQLNVLLRRHRIDIERIELDYILRDVPVTLQTLREAVREQTAPTAQLTEFGRSIIAQSDRRDVTKANYRTLFNDLDRFRRGTRVDEVDYSYVQKYDQWLKDGNIGHNTRVGRLRLLRSILNEAVRRDIITRNPFDRYHVEGMTSRHGFLSSKDVRALEKLQLEGREKIVRDAFLFCCYTGLRYGDFRLLRREHMDKGWIRMKMSKTGFNISIPYEQLFDGKAAAIMNGYDTPEELTKKIPHNSQVNSILRDLLKKANVQSKDRITFHTSRHTFASLLLQQGLPVTTVQRLLGHQKVQTTQIYAEVTEQTITKDVTRLAKKGGKPATAIHQKSIHNP